MLHGAAVFIGIFSSGYGRRKPGQDAHKYLIKNKGAPIRCSREPRVVGLLRVDVVTEALTIDGNDLYATYIADGSR